MKNLLAACVVLCVTAFVSAREVVDLDQGWKFIKQDVSGASDVSFDDSSWTNVDLPHTWNASDAAGNAPRYYRGPGWYRKHVTLSAEQVGKSVYVWFGACGSAAEVFVNGKSAGTHKGAFQAFCFDVTPLVHAGDNVIAVRGTNAVDHEIAPLSGDFNVCGGLYRDAKILVLDKLCISPTDSASSGVYVTQSKVTDDQADLQVSTIVHNANSKQTSATVKCTLLDASGNAVTTRTIDGRFPANSDARLVQLLHVDKPHLWQAKIDPYLYSVKVEIANANDQADEATVPIGLRYFRVDPKEGFILNGKHYDLHGVNRHQDKEGKAWAITHADMEEDIDLLKELGVTGIRCAHYQHSPYFYSLCDQAGIVVWAELCMVNVIDPSEGFHEVTRQQLTELIKQNYNHPSICFWSLYNELNTNSKVPGVVESEIAFVKQLSDLAHQLDDTRLTTGASHKAVGFFGNWVTDLTSFNRYFGWYSGTAEEWPQQLDTLRAASPATQPIGISEYGAGASIHQHQILTSRPRTAGHWHPEEWQATVHEHAWRAMSQRPYLWDKFLWVFADFGSAGRREGDRDGVNDKGLLTYDHKTRKDAFFFYKANWNPDPMVHITSKRWTPRADSTIPVKIYSNCQKVELKVNGQSLGAKTPDEIHVVQWDGVQLKPGENKLEAAGTTKEGKTLDDSCTIVQDSAATTQPR